MSDTATLLPSQNGAPPALHRIPVASTSVARHQSRSTSRMRTTILVWLTLQNSIHTLLIRYSRARVVDEMFVSTVAVFFTEVLKAVICLFLVAKEETPRRFCSALMSQVVRQPKDTLKVCIPAMIYIVQNNLFYVAASHLDAATFMITSQLKIFTAAIFTVIILRRSLSRTQWCALAILFVGVSLVQLQTTTAKETVISSQKPVVGFCAVVIACCLSGFAGIYFEKILKGSAPVSLWMRNVQMGVFAVPASFLGVLLQDGAFIREHGLLYGFDSIAWLTVFWYGVGDNLFRVPLAIKLARMTGPTQNDKIIKYSSLIVLVIQNTSLVLFMRYAMTGNRPKFLKAISVFFAEIFKFVTCVILVCFQQKSVSKGLWYIYDQFVNHWRDAVKVLVPAVVYTIQNFLLYVAVENLPAATYMVTYQLKILTTACFTVAVLKRKLSIQQWIALLFLFAGVAVVQYDQKMSNDRAKAEKLAVLDSFNGSTTEMPTIEGAFTDFINSVDSEGNSTVELPATTMSSVVENVTAAVKKHQPHEQNSIIGFIAVLVACCLSGFAGIYFEKILKGSDVSIWVRNIQLALPSIFFALLFAFVKDNEFIFADGANPGVLVSRMLYGFDWAVWTTIGISAFGGLVVAVVIKYADNILKAFATSFAIVLNCILAYFLFDFRPTILFVFGASFVIGAVFVYSIYPYRAQHQPLPTTDDKEMDDLKLVKDSAQNSA